MNHNKIEQIIAQGEQLIEKSEPLDAAIIEEELDELRRYCQEVFGRVERYHKKLIRLPVCDLQSSLSLNLKRINYVGLGSLVRWVRAQTLEPECLGSSPSSDTCWLCNFGQVTSRLLLWFPQV